MSAYRLTTEWQAITEKEGVLVNTGEQNLEFVIVKGNSEYIPPKGVGKVITPKNKELFRIGEDDVLYVRAFSVFNGGIVPSASVNSIIDYYHQQEENPLEGTTNSITIGLSIYNENISYYPEDWCVIANGSLWKCKEAHDSLGDFDAEVSAGYWQNVISAINSIEIVGTNIILTDTTGQTTVIPITAYTSERDANGNVINTYYATKDEVADIIASVDVQATQRAVVQAQAAASSAINANTAAQGASQSALDAKIAAQNASQSASDALDLANTAAGGSEHWAELAYLYTDALRHALGNMFEYDANADIQLVEDPLTGTDPSWELDSNNDLQPVA